jgi:hypothetical protein
MFGTQLAKLSGEMGHTGANVTAGHYAKWVRGRHQQVREAPDAGCDADLLATIGPREKGVMEA